MPPLKNDDEAVIIKSEQSSVQYFLKEITMDIILNKNLQELRRKNGNTQEELANFLLVSPQAVSKWERGESVPDLFLLPKIASYYDVSVDDLLGVGEIRKRERIDEFTKKAKNYLMDGKTKEAVSVCREIYGEFPNDHEVISWLAFSLYYDFTGNRDDKDSLNEVIRLEKRILEESTVQHLRDMALEHLCYAYNMLGETEKAKEYAAMAGNLNSSREVLTANIAGDDERDRSNQQLIIQLLPTMINAVNRIDSVDWLARHELIIRLADAVFEGGNMGAISGNVANAHYYCARIYAGWENAEDKVRHHLEKLAECVTGLQESEAGFRYGGEIFKSYSIINPTVIKNSEETIKSLYLRLLGHGESPMFDRFRDEKWFKEVLKKIGGEK